MNNAFAIYALSPARCGNVDVAIAASRAGAIGVANFEFDTDPACVRPLGERLARFAGGGFALKLPTLGGEWTALALGLAPRPAEIIVPADNATPSTMRPLQEAGMRVLVETHAWSEARAAAVAAADGIWLKGHEAGGWVGEQTSFLLLSEWARRTDKALYVRGGVNVDSAAASLVGGAQGVVLDDQLLLLAESPLRDALAPKLRRFSGVETILLDGGQEARHLRFWGPPVSTEARALAARVTQAGKLSEADAGRIGWGADAAGNFIPPLGQDGAVAQEWSKRYGRVAAAVRALNDAIDDLPKRAFEQNLFGENAPLANAHGTRFPIVQGPMTHVSDRASFVNAVATGGALPMAAVSLMQGARVHDLLQECKALCGDRPWGVGMLGFVPPAILAEQRAALIASKPRFAIIAGGRPDQAREMEAAGVRTYLHVPSPVLLEQFVEQDARTFIFEGRECGGHIGPLSSFVLWHLMTQALLDAGLSPEQASDYQILFAGGIHDDASAAMAAVMATRLGAHGFKVGVLMGTGYIFTEEAVETGAITAQFQKIALETETTTSLATGPGHASRCAATPFVRQFRDRRVEMERGGASAEEVSKELENLSLGRLRLASKGVARKPGGGSELEQRSDAEQHDDGMFMIGQAATLIKERMTIKALHEKVAIGHRERLAPFAERRRTAPRVAPKPSNIAIIGMSAILPGAASASDYWRNILGKVNAITEIPPGRWDIDQFFDADRGARDKIYSRWGGFMPDVRFDPTEFGMPPNSVSSIDPLQLLTLVAIRNLLEDAGLAKSRSEGERTSVILGFSGGLGELGVKYAARTELFRVGLGDDQEAVDFLPEWSEDSFAGLLPNVAAGRAANRFDFGGVNFTVDAACASSLAAVYQAVLELESGRSDVVLTGGVDTVQGPFGFTCFSKAGALSPTGRSRTFDANADGIVISEGVAMIALKRLEDAERAGDKIYAVIKGVGGSSDGRAKGLMAPRPYGQKRAFRRAYAQAGYAPTTVALFEAHGTGTVAGDGAELQSLTEVLKESGAAPRSSVVGSVKTMIGHTKSSAGAAGLIKSIYALHHKVIPPHFGVETPHNELKGDDCPLYLNQEMRPWTRAPDHPRRAGVSSFGFGGTNFHVTLEEYENDYRETTSSGPDPEWPVELFVWRGRDRSALIDQLEQTAKSLTTGSWTPASMAHDLAKRAPAKGAGVAIVACTLDILGKKIAALIANLRDDSAERPPGAYVSEAPLGAEGKLAVLFPGQGSQYPDMLRELGVRSSIFRAVLDQGDRATALAPTFAGAKPLSRYIFPPERFNPQEDKAAREALMKTNVTQPALAAVEIGSYEVLRALGLKPDMMCGHSFGEFVALTAAGALKVDDLFRIAEARGRFIVEAAGEKGLGSMVAALAPEAEIRAALGDLEAISFANYNGPKQIVLSGPDAAIAEATVRLEKANLTAKKVPVSAAFHSPLMAPAQAPLAEFLGVIEWDELRIPVYSNASARPHGAGVAVRRAMAEHLTGPVKFTQTIEQMYADGARIFLEVGPKTVLRDLVAANLLNKPHVAIAIDGKGGDFAGLIHALGALFVHGVAFDATKLTEDRVAAVKPAIAAPKASDWLINGGQAKKAGEAPAVKAAPRQEREAPVAAASPAPHASAAAPTAPDRSGWIKITGHASRRSAGTHDHPTTYQLFDKKGEDQMSTPYKGNGGPGDPASGAVMREYFSLMRQFVQSQERVMMACLGQGAAAPSFDAFGEAFPSSAPAAIIAASPRPAARTALNGHAAPAAIEPVQSIANPPAAKSSANGHASNGHAANGHAVNGHASPVAAKPAAPAPVAPAPASGPTDVKTLLLHLVSDRTGYPEDMLSLDADIEGDLGIDSIKRTEILGALRKELPTSAYTDVESKMQDLSKAKSLGQIIGIVNSAATPMANGAASRPFEYSGEDEEAARAVLPRFIMKAHVEPAPKALSEPRNGAYVILAGENEDLARALSGRIDLAGGKAVIAPYALWRDAVPFGRWLGDIKTQDPVRALINLGPVDEPLMPEHASFDAWRARAERDVKAFYPALQTAADDLQSGGVVIAASAMGGYFARNLSRLAGKTPWPTAAGNVGLLKCLSLEWTDCRFKAVDLDYSESAAQQAEHLFAELFMRGGRRDVGYPAGVRTIFRSAPASVTRNKAAARTPDRDWVVLAIGGARGITAETLRDVAKAGATLVLVGRSSAPAPEVAAIAGLSDKAALQRHFIVEAQQSGEKLSPRQVEEKCAKVIREREIRANLADFESFGARIDNRMADMRDAASVAQLVQSVYADYGRIDAVFYGAGLIEDQLLINKTPDSVSRVIDTKIDGAFLLAQALRPESLKFFSLFTSVAGRYGNRGQTDYGAANEILNQLAWVLQEKWGDRVKVAAINWGPWAGVTHGPGMVTPQTRAQFEARGIHVIEPEDGLGFMTNELLYAPVHEVESVASVDSWEYQESAHGALRDAPALDPRFATLALYAGRAERSDSDGAQIIRKRIDLVSDPYLDHHRIDGVPVIPFVVCAEHMAQAAELTPGFGECVEIRDFRLFKGVTLKEGALDVELRTKPQQDRSVQCEIWIMGDKPALAYRSTAVGAPSPIASSAWTPYTNGASSSVSVRDAYETMLFHGPAFQSLTRIAHLDEHRLIAHAVPSDPARFYPPAAGTQWRFDPAVLDGALQAVLVWSRVLRDETPLPSRMGRMTRVGAGPLNGPLTIDVQFLSKLKDSTILINFVVCDADGQVRYLIENLEATSSAALNRVGGSVARGAPRHAPVGASAELLVQG